jgi:hypothetical protein
MKYYAGFLLFMVVAASAFFSGCARESREGVCMHPLIMDGMVFPLPPDAFVRADGALIIPGEKVSAELTGAFCIIQRK